MPRPPHTAALGVAGERTGAAATLGERASLKVGLSGVANNRCHGMFSFGSAVVVDSVSTEVIFFLGYYIGFSITFFVFISGTLWGEGRGNTIFPPGIFCRVPVFCLFFVQQLAFSKPLIAKSPPVRISIGPVSYTHLTLPTKA